MMATHFKTVAILMLVLSATVLTGCKAALEQTAPGPGQKTVVFTETGVKGTKLSMRCVRVTDRLHAGVMPGAIYETTLPLNKTMFLGPSEFEFWIIPFDRQNFHITANGEEIRPVVSGSSVMFEIK